MDNKSLDQLAQALLELVAMDSEALWCGLRLRDENGAYPFYRLHGYPAAFVQAQNCSAASASTPGHLRCLCGLTIRKAAREPGAPVLWSGNNGQALFERYVADEGKPSPCRDLHFGSLAWIPLRSQGECVGLLHVADPRQQVIGAHRVQRLQHLTAIFADLLASLRHVATATSASRLSVLLVDDDEPLRAMLQRLLCSRGFDCAVAADGAAALDACATTRFDLVVTDIEMPGVSGIALARQLTSRYGPYRPPIVVLTGNPGRLTETERVEYGLGAIVAKPIVDLSAFADLLVDSAHRPLGAAL